MRHKRLLFPQVRQVKWESFDLSSVPEPNNVTAEALYSLISVGTELALFTGTHIGFTLPNPPFPMMPQRPGYAFVGKVTAVGSDVKGYKPGMHVLMEAPHGSAASIDYRQDRIIPLPENLDLATAPLIRMADIALTTVRVAPLQLGDAVVVFGLGLVGLLAAQLYQLNGAIPVIGIDIIPKRLEVAKNHGIIALNPETTNIQEEITRLTHGRGADVVVEATGSPYVIPLALELAAKGGRVTLLGSTRGRVELDVYTQIHRKGIQLIGAHESVITFDTQTSRRWSKRRDLLLLADLFSKGKLNSNGLITHTITPRELPEIYDILAERPQDYLGIVVDWHSGA